VRERSRRMSLQDLMEEDTAFDEDNGGEESVANTPRASAATPEDNTSKVTDSSAPQQEEASQPPAADKPPDSEPASKSLPALTTPRIYVGNLNWWASDKDLEELCTPFGKVSSVAILFDANNGKSKGIAVITFENTKAAEAARLNLHQTSHPTMAKENGIIVTTEEEAKSVAQQAAETMKKQQGGGGPVKRPADRLVERRNHPYGGKGSGKGRPSDGGKGRSGSGGKMGPPEWGGGKGSGGYGKGYGDGYGGGYGDKGGKGYSADGGRDRWGGGGYGKGDSWNSGGKGGGYDRGGYGGPRY